MPVISQHFVQDPYRDSAEFEEVSRIARALEGHLNTPDAQARIAEANKPGLSSAHVQAVFLDEAQRLGFRNEAQGLFADYKNRHVRPDYHLPLRHHATGILMEVERGKTTINNMDFLDFWKCHLCPDAHHLFMLVPSELRQNNEMAPRREFDIVRNRMSAFFEPRNYTNVRSLWIFGY
ncbi:MAG TPA: hypothetical protein VK447_00270 [Myxococcaceae bacterium]|nr:hypothetical protein [Myxococcaceae bacterium]